MSTTARIRPQELVLPADGGLWVKQHQGQNQHQNQHQNQDQHRRPSFDPLPAPASTSAQPDSQDDHHDQRCQSRPQQLSTNINNNNNNNNELFVFVSPNLNSSSSDLASPLTPTFSHHGGSHLRYASSTSSLDLQQSFSSTCSDSPVSPAQPASQNTQNAATASPSAPSSTKRQLPDVQEDPLERDDDNEHTMTRLTDDQLESLYDCLCMPPCPIAISVCLPAFCSSASGRPYLAALADQCYQQVTRHVSIKTRTWLAAQIGRVRSTPI